MGRSRRHRLRKSRAQQPRIAHTHLHQTWIIFKRPTVVQTVSSAIGAVRCQDKNVRLPFVLEKQQRKISYNSNSDEDCANGEPTTRSKSSPNQAQVEPFGSRSSTA